MKKWSLIVAVLLLIALVGCQSENTNPNHNSGLSELNNVSKTTSSTDGAEHVEPPVYIGVRSLAQLDEMRLMLKSPDQELNSYLLSVEGGGADSREDLENFLILIASLPNLELVDGDIVWIAHYADANVVYVSTMGSDGDWTRIEYFLAAKDVHGELEKLKNEGQFDKSTISDVVECKGGRLKVYSEVTEAHPSGTGKTVEWTLTIDNTLARVVYFTADSSNVQASNVFERVSLTHIFMAQEDKNEK